MPAITDDRGYNQIFEQNEGNLIRLRRRTEWIIELMDPTPFKKLMEIGCGTGFISSVIAEKTGMKVIGSDLCVPFIDEARSKYVFPNLSFEVLDFNKVAENVTDSYDYLIGNGILHHLYYNLDEVLINFKKLLTPGGKIIFMEPNIYNPYVAAIFKNRTLRKKARLEPDEMAFSKRFMRKKLEKHGYGNIAIQYRDFLLPGIPKIFIKPSIFVGNILEKTPLRMISQSILISATK